MLCAFDKMQAKKILLSSVFNFLTEKIRYASEMVASETASKIQDGDVVMTYAYSATIAASLIAAHQQNVQFQAVVVDSRPVLDGRRMLQTLLSAGVPCQYVHLNGVSCVIQQVTKTILGAATVLANGTVLARAGTAAIAMASNAAHIPVLVCCQTYKFLERVQLDSFTHNELGDPEAMLARPDGKSEPLLDWKKHPDLSLLNLTYDAMPADFVTVVVTEVGSLPATSVPAVLREYRKESMMGMV